MFPCIIIYGFTRTSLMQIVVLFYYTFCSTCFGCNIHPSSGAIYNVHADGTGQLTRALTCTICMYIIYRSWGWMYITSETCRANSVIKTALNNLHQAGPNKTHIWWCMETQKSYSTFTFTFNFTFTLNSTSAWRHWNFKLEFVLKPPSWFCRMIYGSKYSRNLQSYPGIYCL